jgi:hypothetical protein
MRTDVQLVALCGKCDMRIASACLTELADNLKYAEADLEGMHLKICCAHRLIGYWHDVT